MFYFLLKAFLVGICASAPVGPVVIYVVQTTLTKSRKAGFITGCGSAMIDTAYSAIALLALSLVNDFITAHQIWIYLIGGALIVYVGAGMLFKDPMKKAGKPLGAGSYISYAMKAAGCALANPTALAAMFILVAAFGLENPPVDVPIWLTVLFVLIGTLTFWFSLSWLVNKLRKVISNRFIIIISRITGVIVIGFGLSLIVMGIMQFFK